MSSVFAEKKSNICINFSGHSSLCSNIESPVTRHFLFGQRFILNLFVSLLLVTTFICFFIIGISVDYIIIFVIAEDINYHVGVCCILQDSFSYFN